MRSSAVAHLLSDLFMNYRTVTICMATMVECSEGGALAHSPASGMTEWNGTVVAGGNGDKKAKSAFALLPIERNGSEAGVERVRPMRKGCMIMILNLVNLLQAAAAWCAFCFLLCKRRDRSSSDRVRFVTLRNTRLSLAGSATRACRGRGSEQPARSTKCSGELVENGRAGNATKERGLMHPAPSPSLQ